MAWRLPRRQRAAALWRLGRLRGNVAYAVVDAFISPDDFVVDVGASWGRFTARFARLVGPRGTVYAFEPDPPSYKELERVTRRMPSVRRFATALSDSDGSAQLSVPEGAMSAAFSRVSDAPSLLSVEVPKARLDDIVVRSPRLSFVKCDVEGHELAVFRGAWQSLARDNPAILVEIEHRHGGSVEATAEMLSGIGYTGWAIGPNGLFDIDSFDLQRHQLDNLPNRPGELPSERYVNDFLFVAAPQMVPTPLVAHNN
jgi:FkbM family methyltransferase